MVARNGTDGDPDLNAADLDSVHATPYPQPAHVCSALDVHPMPQPPTPKHPPVGHLEDCSFLAACAQTTTLNLLAAPSKRKARTSPTSPGRRKRTAANLWDKES